MTEITTEIKETIEAAFREGYAAGYNNGSSDQCSFEWGSSKHSDVAKREKDTEWKDSEAFKFGIECPLCHSKNFGHGHHAGSFAVPECDYLSCYDCGHQWGHQ